MWRNGKRIIMFKHEVTYWASTLLVVGLPLQFYFCSLSIILLILTSQSEWVYALHFSVYHYYALRCTIQAGVRTLRFANANPNPNRYIWRITNNNRNKDDDYVPHTEWIEAIAANEEKIAIQQATGNWNARQPLYRIKFVFMYQDNEIKYGIWLMMLIADAYI